LIATPRDVIGSSRFPKKKQSKQWVSPDIAKILKESGVEVEAGGDGDIAADEYYEQL